MPVTKRRNPHPSEQARAAEAEAYADLVRRAAAGDPVSLEQLLIRAQETAYRFSLLVCGHAEDAEDVMQDALIRTYKRVGTIKDPSAFRGWLFRTVRNACLMKRRKRVDEPSRMESLDGPEPREVAGRSIAQDVRSPGPGPDEQAMNTWLGQRLRRALGSLPPRYRMIVILREMEGLSTREVAKVSGMSEDNVKTQLHRARVLLREALADQRPR